MKRDGEGDLIQQAKAYRDQIKKLLSEISALNQRLSGYTKYDHVIKKYEELLKETSDIEILPKRTLTDLEESLIKAQLDLSKTIRENAQKEKQLQELNSSNEKLIR